MANPSSDTIACFDAFTGELSWSYDKLAVATMDASLDGTLLDIASFSPDGTFSAGIIDVESGAVVAASDSLAEALPPLGQGVCSVMGPMAADYAFAVGGKLVKLDLSSQDTPLAGSAELAYPQASSIAWYDDTIIACTVSTYDDEELELDFAVEAFDTDLRKKWDFTGKVTSEMIDNGTYSSLVLGWPEARGCVFEDEPAAIVSAGRNVYALDLASGQAVYEHGFASSVLAVCPWEEDEGAARLFIACADGSIVGENPESPTRNYTGDRYRLQLGEPIRWSAVVPGGGEFHWLSVSTEGNDRMLAYRTDLSYGTEPDHEYTLDELIELADDALTQGGR